MKSFFLTFLFLLLGVTVLAQNRFELKNYSKHFDITISVEDCDDLTCSGQATFTFYKKGRKKPFQVIKVADSFMELLDREDLSVGEVELAEGTAIIVGDLNFDGKVDVAINRSKNWRSPSSYRVYLASKTTGKFVYHPVMSRIGKYLGLSEIDEKKKVLRVFGQDSAGRSTTDEYSVINNRPVKVFSKTIESPNIERTSFKFTTRELVNGKWRTKVEYVNHEK